MQAIILAAGNGSRLKPLTDSIPKVMVEVGGETIIKRALNRLAEVGKIEEVIITVGYKAEKIIAHIGESYRGMKIIYVMNKDYASTNNIYSLWLTKEYIKNDVILLEGDILFEKELLAPLLNANNSNVVLVAKYTDAIPGTVVTMDRMSSRIDSFIGSKDQEKGRGYFADKYKTINIYLFKKYFFEQHFMPGVEKQMERHGKNDYYEVALGSLVASGVELYAHLIENIRWYEIDNTADLRIASLMFSKQERTLHHTVNSQSTEFGVEKIKRHEEIDDDHTTPLRAIHEKGHIESLVVDKHTYS